ncbi:MAG: PadR family transcriptional regulator [Anaerolineaceae bacterium]|nr:PadR family transcriptional regulator [Anaerolineaceae bacterium]
MNNKELALLGLLTEGPKYGYQLENDIEARGMREWTEIGFSSIYYLLNKSEDRGWILSTLGESSKGPVRKLYALTETGWGLLRTELLQKLAHPTPNSGEFDLALAFMAILPPEQVTKALAEYQQSLEEGLKRVNQRWERSGKGRLPENVEILFTHSLHQIQSELDWVKALLQTRKENENGEN